MPLGLESKVGSMEPSFLRLTLQSNVLPVVLDLQPLDYFDGYINRLCTHAYLDEMGHVDYGVDTTWKTQLQGKLLIAMLRFKM